MTRLIVFTISFMLIYLYGCEPGLKPGEKYTVFPDGSVPCPYEKIIYYNLSNDTVSLKMQVNVFCEGSSPSIKIYRDDADLESGKPLSEIQLNKTGKTDTIIYAAPRVKIALLCPGNVESTGSCKYRIYPAGVTDSAVTDTTLCSSSKRYLIYDSTGYITFQIDKRCGDVSAKYYSSPDSLTVLLKSFEFNDMNLGNTLMVTLPVIKDKTNLTYLAIQCGNRYTPANCLISRTLTKF